MAIHSMKRRMVLRAAAALAVAAAGGALSGCGFQLRGSGGSYTMPFHSIYVGFPDNSALGTELKRNLRAGGVTIADSATAAEAQLVVLSERRGKQILSLNSLGRVREYLLTYTLSFTVRDPKGVELLPAAEISLCWPRNPRKRCCTATCRPTWYNRSCAAWRP
jgi:LPS-assembly lipoprotein